MTTNEEFNYNIFNVADNTNNLFCNNNNEDFDSSNHLDNYTTNKFISSKDDNTSMIYDNNKQEYSSKNSNRSITTKTNSYINNSNYSNNNNIDDTENLNYIEMVQKDNPYYSKKGKWDEEEDKILLNVVEKYEFKNWKKISSFIKGRSPIQCLHRWSKILKPGLSKGSWTEEEDKLLYEYIKVYGDNFSNCSKIISGRNNKQCRERWHNVLNPKVVKGEWSVDEDYLIFKLYDMLGGKWVKFVPFFNGKRAENSIKNRFYSTIRRLNTILKKEKIELNEPQKIAKLYDEIKRKFKDNKKITTEEDLEQIEDNLYNFKRYFKKNSEGKFSSCKSSYNDDSDISSIATGVILDSCFANNPNNLAKSITKNLKDNKFVTYNINNSNKNNSKNLKKEKNINNINLNGGISNLQNISNLNLNINSNNINGAFNNYFNNMLPNLERKNNNNNDNINYNVNNNNFNNNINNNNNINHNLLSLKNIESQIMNYCDNPVNFNDNSFKNINDDIDNMLLEGLGDNTKINININNNVNNTNNSNSNVNNNNNNSSSQDFSNLLSGLEKLETYIKSTKNQILDLNNNSNPSNSNNQIPNSISNEIINSNLNNLNSSNDFFASNNQSNNSILNLNNFDELLFSNNNNNK